MAKTRVSIVRYLNSVPLAWGILEGSQKDDFDAVYSTPAECAEQLASGAVDVGLIPSIEYQRIPGSRIVPGPAIAARRRVQSVILISKVPLARARSVAHDSGSRTSVALTRVILDGFYRNRPRFEPAEPEPAAMLADHDAALLIGDAALGFMAKYQVGSASVLDGLPREGAEPIQVFDLMERWNNLTGLPFVFAFWAVRPGFNDRGVVEALRASRAFGLAHLDEIAARYAEKLELEKDFVLRYLTRSMDYHMDADGVEALRLFYEMAAEVGAIRAVRGIDFL